MSYILEALKKAQAERQLGNAPTIHAPTLHHAAPRLPAVKKSGVLALAIGVIVVAGAGWFAWSQRTVAPAAVLTPAASTAALPTPAPAPVPVVAAPVVPAPVASPPPVFAARVEPVVRPRKAAVPPTPVAPAAPAPAPADEAIRYAKDLPPEIQQQLPRVGFGGYMYSDNAADRLVLVDKTLRREGEEIAPGLMLEKLLPKGAVLNYRGTRYRVGF